MTSDQWVALIGQIGIGGVALVGMAYLFVKVVVPMASSRASEVVAAIRELTAEIKQLRADTRTEHAAITAAIVDNSTRIARIEAVYEHAVPIAVGSTDVNPRIRRTP